MNTFEKELTGNILPYWMNLQDKTHGGFYGRVDGDNVLRARANKGAVMHARILWTFAAAYRVLGDARYLEMASSAYTYIQQYFIDKTYGGVYWELDYTGRPVNRKKQVYAQGFALYGISEYYRATGDEEALRTAIGLFYLIEQYKDKEYGGYYEAFTREWEPIEDMRLSAKDANEKKSMNTHLHILEPYTNLLRVWPDEQLKEAQRALIALFTEKILNRETNHLRLFFDESWQVKSSAVSYGHDIEASWLLVEAAEILRDECLLDEIKGLSIRIAEAAAEGLLPDGSLAYERVGRPVCERDDSPVSERKNNLIGEPADEHPAGEPIDAESLDTERHWWVQAEAVVGWMYAYENTSAPIYKERAMRVWTYIREQLIDTEQGEWFWSRLSDGRINRQDDKAGLWKCPYHNGRMCMEMKRFND